VTRTARADHGRVADAVAASAFFSDDGCVQRVEKANGVARVRDASASVRLLYRPGRGMKSEDQQWD